MFPWRHVWKDLGYALRLLIRTPSWTILAALTVAIGIAGAGTMFSVVNAVLLRPPPAIQPRQLYSIRERLFNFKPEIALAGDYFTMREQARTFTQIAAFNTSGVNWTGTDGPQQLTGARVTASFFSLFGIAPLDPATYLGVSLMLIAAAAVASYVPARRASTVDPVEALRAE